MFHSVYIGLGSNVGDREAHLLRAVEVLGCIDAAAVLRCSSLYDSAPVGPPQPRYLNAVVELECPLRPQQLLTMLKQMEKEAGRSNDGVRWGPRVLDLDILIWGNEVVAHPSLQVPHLGLHQRRFVLDPLVELCPRGIHPLLGVTFEALLGKLHGQDVSPFDSARWPVVMGGRSPVASEQLE